ncbi:uncharacterized protein ARMOST_00457 [Armillaria ostoyae]|uniref:Uncharacterized protein n=1 Tax=Armillaria ostoyae TaxID=47428 RepID=A0A284QL69_ARMOS|nr:uncharacterized protein ARMOST_00457 [Armillaria ostoyae]
MTPARLILQAARFTKDLDVNVASFHFLTQRSRFGPPALPKEFSKLYVATCPPIMPRFRTALPESERLLFKSFLADVGIDMDMP